MAIAYAVARLPRNHAQSTKPMSTIREIPEVVALDTRRGLVRIPPELDVPLTPRVRQLIDTAEFRRLARISQLGLVSLVYPAAIHTRFEHSLGVYRLALLYLRQLAHDERFAEAIRPDDAEVFLVAALLHDLGHWPFCHPIEDIRLPSVPQPRAVRQQLPAGRRDRRRAAARLGHQSARRGRAVEREAPRRQAARSCASMLSGPIDIDKMDYLFRDSLHAGVPYGRHFDQQRLLGSLCLNEAGDGLAITDKGKTAAELMVFARYVMFSEVYWHHGVRAATAMLQRAFYLLHGSLDLDALFRMTEGPLIDELERAAGSGPAGELLDGLFGPTRRLYKRLAQYSFLEQRELYRAAGPAAVSLAGGLCRAVRGAGQHGAGPGRGAARRSSSTPRRCSAKCSSTSRSTFPRRTATGRWAKSRRWSARWPGAVRRLREAGPHLRPSARGGGAAGIAEPAGIARSGDRADGQGNLAGRMNVIDWMARPEERRAWK